MRTRHHSVARETFPELCSTMYTLWRNGALLGRIEQPPPENRQHRSRVIVGTLRPTPAFDGMTSQVQSTHPLWPSKVLRTPMDPFRIGEPMAPLEPIDPSALSAGTPVHTPRLETVADVEKLEVRSDDGSVLDCSLIGVVYCSAPEDFPVVEIQREFGTTGDERQFWMVNVVRRVA